GLGRGPAVRLTAGAPDAVPAGAVLVCRTFLPAWSFVLPRLAGLVVEEGGALSHGAILAREHRVPAVFGALGALAGTRDGEPLCVDGDAGRVYRDPGLTGSGPSLSRNL
ncbi:MAG TPA: PEP-utilizing enzyme, partial [Polyangia bacterium]